MMIPETLSRRSALSCLGLTLGASLAGLRAGTADEAPKRVLLRSSWQTVNIGDIAHTPGVLALLEQHLPAAEVTLWPGDVGTGVKDMLQRRFPTLRFAQTTAELTEAFARCDFLLHGSGPPRACSAG